MEISLSEDQEFFRDTTRKFLAASSDRDAVRALAKHADGYEPSYWSQGAELGWTSMLIAEEHGGGSVSGKPMTDLSVIADAFGRSVAPGPLVPVSVVASSLSRYGTDEQCAAHIEGLLAGDLIAAWAHEERGTPGLDAVATTAVRDGDSYVLNGVKTPVEAGAQAGLLLVTATSEDGIGHFLVPADADGVTVTALGSVDLTRRYARIVLEDVRVPVDALVSGTDVDGVQILEHQINTANTIQLAEMVGAADVTFAFTVEWAFDRYSFGRPLASYQELKHRFADMKTWLEACHGLATASAREYDAGHEGLSMTVSCAKSYAGDRLAALMQDCVQLHGGIGLTEDHDIHLYLRRVTADRQTHGTPADHRQRIAALRIAAAAA